MPGPGISSPEDKDAIDAPGITKPEPVEDRPNVGAVEPGDYPDPATIAPPPRDQP